MPAKIPFEKEKIEAVLSVCESDAEVAKKIGRSRASLHKHLASNNYRIRKVLILEKIVVDNV